MPGWERLFRKETGYNNQDLHDQLLGLATYYDFADKTVARDTITAWPHTACGTELKLAAEIRQPLTFLFQAENTAGFRKLLVGTQTRLYAGNEARGNYKLLSYGMGGKAQEGCPSTRWYGDQAGDYTILTNNVDVPHYWLFDSPAVGCDQKSIQPIPDMALIGLSKAAVVRVWRGVTFLGDVEMDGIRFRHRVVWGDKNNPISFDPSLANSVAGTEDLDYGEWILGMRPLGNSLFILTTRGIWKVDAIGGDEVFQFTKVYEENEAGKACIAFRNTLVSDGEFLTYMGTDGIYQFNQFMPRPERTPWMHLASNIIFDDFNETACDVHVAGYNAMTGQMWISWVPKGGNCPTRSMVFNLIYKKATYVDHGFTAYVNFTSDLRETLADFLFNRCICTQEQLDDLAITPLIKEPLLPTCAGTVAAPTCEIPQSLYTSETITVNGFEVENYNKAEADQDSLCAMLEAAGIFTFDDLCFACAVQKVFVMASVVDWSLKQYGTSYNRERVTNWTGCGTYAVDGYETVFTKGPLSYGLLKEDKLIEMVSLEYEAEQQAVPSEIVLSVGIAGQAVDPNNSKCVLLWKPQVINKRFLKCQSKTAEEHARDGTRPNTSLEWPLEYQARFLFLRFVIGGTGGASCFSQMTTHARRLPGCLKG